MTREEAIKLFRKEIECLSHDHCSDCILEKVCDPMKTPLDSEYMEAMSMAIEALSTSEIPNKWIPVSERLPEKEGKYLTTIFNGIRYIMTCDYHPYSRCWFPDDECASDNVIAWMPLPEPYEPQESEGL